MNASDLISKYSIGRTQFYQRRELLIKLGYDLQGKKEGKTCSYSPEQVALFDRLDRHIKDYGTADTFPPATSTKDNSHERTLPYEHVSADNGHERTPTSGLVPVDNGHVSISDAQPDETYVYTSLIENLKEQQLEQLRLMAEHHATTSLVVFNRLTLDYMKHRNFTNPDFAEKVRKSDEEVKQVFSPMITDPEEEAKKYIDKLRREGRI